MKFDNQVLDTQDESIHNQPDFEPTGLPVREESHAVAATGFGQVFGLHPIPAVTTLAVNAMLFGGQVMTLGALTVVALAVAVVLGVITYKAQMRFYGDDAEAARTKALAVGLLTAIPLGLPAVLTVPAGLVGLMHTLRRKS